MSWQYYSNINPFFLLLIIFIVVAFAKRKLLTLARVHSPPKNKYRYLSKLSPGPGALWISVFALLLFMSFLFELYMYRFNCKVSNRYFEENLRLLRSLIP